MVETVYGIAPAGARPFYILLPVLVLLACGIGLLALAAYGSQHASFVVSDNSLDFRGDVYGRRLPLSALRLSEARIVDLDRAPELKPRSRRLGTGLPGYAAGWFRLHNGQRALVYLTNNHRVLYLPTNRNYVLLLSPRDPETMLSALKGRI
jgi:PH (Pleckstrin Homology) domain-containing protein